MNGDGYADVIVGADGYDAGQSGRGRGVRLPRQRHAASPIGDPGDARRRSSSRTRRALTSACSVAGAGDVNGDGYADVIVGAIRLRRGPDRRGRGLRVPRQRHRGSPTATPRRRRAQLECEPGGRAASAAAWRAAGDVNGDGYADVIVGACVYDAGQTPTRARPSCSWAAPAGIADGNPRRRAAQLESNQAERVARRQRRLGGRRERRRLRRRDRRARTCYDAGETDEGAAFVFLGSASGIANGNPATAARAARVGPGERAASAQRGGGRRRERRRLRRRDRRRLALRRGPDRRGRGLRVPRQRVGHRRAAIPRRRRRSSSRIRRARSSASAWPRRGDVNGDGYADVIVGAYRLRQRARRTRARPSCSSAARSGIANGNPADGARRSSSRTRRARCFGSSVAGGGRRERRRLRRRDRRAPRLRRRPDRRGRGLRLPRRRDRDRGRQSRDGGGRSSSRTRRTPSSASSVAGAGDVNGDGYADVIVGAPALRRGPDRRGRGLRLPRQRRRASPTAIPRRPRRSSSRTRPSAVLGCSVAAAGDVNGDGYADVIVGARYYDAGADRTRARPSCSSAARRGDRRRQPRDGGARSSSRIRRTRCFGCSVAAAGDVNGDGYADVIVGALSYDAGQTRRGRGLRVPRQRVGHRGRQPRDGATRSSSRTRSSAQLRLQRRRRRAT